MKRRAYVLTIVAGLLAVTTTAEAQTPGAVTGIVLEIRQNGLVLQPPRELSTTLTTQWTCDLAPLPVPAAVLTNPTKIRIADPNPAKGTRECETDVTPFIRGLPQGTGYTGWVWTVSDQLTALPPDNRSATATQVLPNFIVTPFYTRPAPTPKAYFLQ